MRYSNFRATQVLPFLTLPTSNLIANNLLTRFEQPKLVSTSRKIKYLPVTSNPYILTSLNDLGNARRRAIDVKLIANFQQPIPYLIGIES
jgi:hypothetical protein